MFPELPRPVRQFVTACFLLEMVSLGGSIGGFGSSIRNVLLVLGGFWPEVFMGAVPFFPGHGVLMFATSAVLHGNPVHLGMNMFGLIWLGPMVVDRLGERGFWPLAGLSALGAGSCYALMTNSTLPMIGASGVLYGLLGTVCVWKVLDQWMRGRSLMPFAAPAAIFIGLNVLLMLPARGQIAWEAHLGGFIAGVLCGVLTWRSALR
ncbi:MAG: rhomboid family intramembrane serine protease [Pseudotabrizicola sp.]|uniref:rhomboid family intramembrane serine protease n=1 Tax=Pseudotabrizicola sp. TaxID=2939647 RepID=UPI00272F9770|nr:rhomboid family intramembrane serine protease [Pseudotabrizicola sp.]MDP2079343.1 rhomboid family intramembrane serine protease [Pseudotabrizicola sp.]MDZ7572326.1 rhomboid family intramembrane serine protease [Pseudotabrizicola sp.]